VLLQQLLQLALAWAANLHTRRWPRRLCNRGRDVYWLQLMMVQMALGVETAMIQLSFPR
jgi:hypothetical protein